MPGGPVYLYHPIDPSYQEPPNLAAVEGFDNTVVGEWVPVEPCSHGNYARHIDPDYDYYEKHLDDYEWCDGKPE